MEYKNVYENMREAHIRLLNTVVPYDKEPGHIIAITEHKQDGILRVYFFPIATAMNDDGLWEAKIPAFHRYSPESPDLGPYLDKWMEDNPKEGLQRKHINAPLFERFRPYPLGMWHRRNGSTYYLARQPQRHREQGLTRAHVRQTKVCLSPPVSGGFSGSLGGPSLRDTIKGVYPSLSVSYEGLVNPDKMDVEPRESVAFHRDFALVKGPLDFIFLFHKTQVIGLVKKDLGNSFEAILSPDFNYLKEVTENTNCFNRVRIKER